MRPTTTRRNTTAPSACVTMRPYATGTLVVVKTERPETSVAVRPGTVFGAWDDQCEAWAHDTPVTLEQAAEYACTNPESAVKFRRGEYFPAPLNAAEQRAVRAMIREGSE